MNIPGNALTSMVQSVSDDNFTQLVVNAERPALVEFWAPWCGPCRLIAPIIEQLARENTDRLAVFAMNTDDNPRTHTQLGILGVPTLLLYDRGQPVREIRGARPKAYIVNQLADYLGG